MSSCELAHLDSRELSTQPGLFQPALPLTAGPLPYFILMV